MKKIFSNKNKILSGGLLIALSTLVSCKKLIEIPLNPPTQITRDQVFADSATTISAVAGVYSYTPGGHGIPYSDGLFISSTSLSGHEVAYTNSYGDNAQFYSYNITPVNDEITSLWTAPYSEIYQINDILAGVTGNNNLSASFVKQITGEMKVVRALCYFNMVNIFGGVPLVTTTDYKVNAQLPRASTAAVYTQILTDLHDAVKALPVTYPSSGHARPNLYTAIALQAKVNLYRSQWQAAYNEADSVINSGLYDLTTTPISDVFLVGSAEGIWQVPIQNLYGGSGDANQFFPYSTDAIPNYIVTDSLLNQFEAGDMRLTNWLGVNVVNGQNVYYPAKYKDLQPTSPATECMLLRFAEMYLIRAEAAAQLGNLEQALTDVNTIRSRAGLASSTVNATSQTAVLAAVRKERRTELCFEFGNRWFDLNRTSADTKYPANGQAPAVLANWQVNYALYPLPQAQLQLNSHLVQNPGYH
ncbi:RagB/SusD family nutrient uptake outer membrane protein [Mucilaginibacter gynuensis]